MSDREGFWAQLDGLGADQVRKNLGLSVYANHRKAWAQAWLNAKDLQSESSDRGAMVRLMEGANVLSLDANDIAREALEAAQSASAEARAANRLAQTANIIATIASVISIVSIAVTIIGLFVAMK